MPRCNRKDGEACLPLMSSELGELCTPELMEFWQSLSMQQRRELLTVDKRDLFQTIRAKYCSRCFGLFALRWDELKSAPSDNPCPACSEYFCSLQVQPDGHTLSLEDSIVQKQPFSTFAEAKRRERERLLQYAGTGILICGNEWTRSPGNSMCNLHTSNVPVEALMEYWAGLPEEHHTALFQLRDEDFAAELDAHLKYQLRICKDCRGNVTRAFRELRAKAAGVGEDMEVCEGHSLSIVDSIVTLLGAGDPAFFERAEEVEEFKGGDGDVDDGYSEGVRHAETPELAREALADCAVLIFKGQVEVAFREQTAGHNALLLFVHLALTMMEGRLNNAFKDLKAKKAEAELMEMVAKDEAKEPKKGKRKAKKKGGKSDGRAEPLLCGCGAACDVCERCSRRSKSPLRQPPTLQSPAKGQSSPGRARPEEEGTPPEQQAQVESKRAVLSPSRSTLGAELVSAPRPTSPFQAAGSPEASPGGSWETIPAGGKGRRSSAGGPRRTPPPQPPAAEHGAPGHAQRAAAAAAAADPAALKPAALAGHAAATAAHQHKPAAPLQQQQHDSLASGHQPRQHVRAVPVSAAPTAHAKAAQHALSPASSLGLSEAQSLGAGSPKLAQTEHLLRNAPGRAASGLGRAFETGPSTLQRDPQIASPHSQVVRRSGNPWHSRPAADAQATCTVGKPFGQPVHAVHAFSMAWPPQPQPNKVPMEEGFHDTFSLFHHSPLAHQSHAAEGEASTPKADQPPSYNLWGPSTAVQQAPLPLLHVVR